MNSVPVAALAGPGLDRGGTTVISSLGDGANRAMLGDAVKSPFSTTARLWSPCRELSAVSVEREAASDWSGR
jgi:hypothetical protein